MAVMVAMDAMAVVLNSMGIRDYGNRTIHRQDSFGMSMESSLAAVQDEFGSTSPSSG
jgi:hypothetical protein